MTSPRFAGRSVLQRTTPDSSTFTLRLGPDSAWPGLVTRNPRNRRAAAHRAENETYLSATGPAVAAAAAGLTGGSENETRHAEILHRPPAFEKGTASLAATRSFSF
jgi:hypothetical protein